MLLKVITAVFSKNSGFHEKDQIFFFTFTIAISESVNTSSTGRYVPPPTEAPSANQLGAVVIGIIVIFIITLVILDLATLRRDIGWLFNNIRLQKRLWQAKARLRKAKKEAKAK